MPATTTRPTLTRSPVADGWRVTTPADPAPGYLDVADFATARKALKMLTSGASADDVIFDLFPPDDDPGCECEIDWRCPHHAGQPTWLETRYDDLDEGF